MDSGGCPARLHRPISGNHLVLELEPERREYQLGMCCLDRGLPFPCPFQASPVFRSGRNCGTGTPGVRLCSVLGQPWASWLGSRLLAQLFRMSDQESSSRSGFPECPSCSKNSWARGWDQGAVSLSAGVGDLGPIPLAALPQGRELPTVPCLPTTCDPGRPLQLLALVSLSVKWVQKENFPGQRFDVTGLQSYKIAFI